MREIRTVGVILCLLATLMLVALTMQKALELRRYIGKTHFSESGGISGSLAELNSKGMKLRTTINDEKQRYLSDGDSNFLPIVQTVLEYAQSTQVNVESYSIEKVETRPLLELIGKAAPEDMKRFMQRVEEHSAYLEVTHLNCNRIGRKLSFKTRISLASLQSQAPKFPLLRTDDAGNEQDNGLDYLFMIPPLVSGPPRRSTENPNAIPDNTEKIDYNSDYALIGHFRSPEGSMAYVIKNIPVGRVFILHLEKPESGITLKSIDENGLFLENNGDFFYIEDKSR